MTGQFFSESFVYAPVPGQPGKVYVFKPPLEAEVRRNGVVDVIHIPALDLTVWCRRGGWAAADLEIGEAVERILRRPGHPLAKRARVEPC